MPKRSPDLNAIQQLMAYIQPHEDEETNLFKVLACFAERGTATTQQVVKLSGLNYKTAAPLLQDLAQASYDRPAALNVCKVALEGQTGRPLNQFSLTSEGAAVARTLLGKPDIHAPLPKDFVESVAVHAMMEVYTQAVAAGLKSNIEKVLPFGQGGSNVRADVYIQPPSGQPILIEIEQHAERENLPRIVDKLERLQRFYVSPQGKQVSNQVRVLFNLPEKDSRTLPTWGEALALVAQEHGGMLAFELHYQPVLAFLASPDWKGLAGFRPLQPAALPHTPAAAQTPAQAPRPKQQSAAGLLELSVVTKTRALLQKEKLARLESADDQCQRVQYFLDNMYWIYQASHYPGSPTVKYAGVPYASIDTLHSYLHAHQNRGLLDTLRPAMRWLRSHSNGITSYRNAAARIAWEFLGYHGIGRGGALLMNVVAPVNDSQRSEIYFEVRITNPDLMLRRRTGFTGLYTKEPEEIALQWVLDALFLYAQELGLDNDPWQKSPKGRND